MKKVRDTTYGYATLLEVAAALGVSLSRAFQIERQALNKLYFYMSYDATQAPPAVRELVAAMRSLLED